MRRPCGWKNRGIPRHIHLSGNGHYYRKLAPDRPLEARAARMVAFIWLPAGIIVTSAGRGLYSAYFASATVAPPPSPWMRIDNREINVHYQPIVSPEQRKIVGAEALAAGNRRTAPSFRRKFYRAG